MSKALWGSQSSDSFQEMLSDDLAALAEEDQRVYGAQKSQHMMKSGNRNLEGKDLRDDENSSLPDDENNSFQEVDDMHVQDDQFDLDTEAAIQSSLKNPEDDDVVVYPEDDDVAMEDVSDYPANIKQSELDSALLALATMLDRNENDPLLTLILKKANGDVNVAATLFIDDQFAEENNEKADRKSDGDEEDEVYVVNKSKSTSLFALATMPGRNENLPVRSQALMKPNGTANIDGSMSRDDEKADKSLRRTISPPSHLATKPPSHQATKPPSHQAASLRGF
jgi:hypothetical protein